MVGNIKKSPPGTSRTPISEAGRKFLADLLAQLSDKQITDMFAAARVDRFHSTRSGTLPSPSGSALKKKRTRSPARCPS